MGDIQGDPTTRARAAHGPAAGLKRFGRSLFFAWRGLRAAWANERNLRLEVLFGSLAILLALWLGTGVVAVTLASIMVVAAELINTAIEAAVDLASPEHHPVAGLAKDASAAAVLLCAAGAVLVGLFALGPALLGKLGLL